MCQIWMAGKAPSVGLSAPRGNGSLWALTWFEKLPKVVECANTAVINHAGDHHDSEALLVDTYRLNTRL